jgi:serine/threonine protein kinase
MNPPEQENCFACGHSLADSAAAPLGAPLAQRLLRGRYRLLRQIGEGGFGAVYKAEDTELGNRLVAVKEMSARGLTPEETREATEGFHREALLLARLSHPNLPRIYEQFEEDGRWYLVMDFIQGETLEDYLKHRGGSLPVKEALQLGLQLTNVLGYLHSRQPPIVFRDLKPSNVMRTSDGQVHLIDFGIARLFKPGQAKDTVAFGSPGYAAPEQYGKAQTTPRSDVFSLGALLHQMLTGIDPSDTPFRFKALTMPRPAGLSLLIERMVDLDTAKRPATMELVRQDLERMLNDPAPWRVYDQDAALSGVSVSLAQASTGGFASLAPSAPPWQSTMPGWQGQNITQTTTSAPPYQPPPAKKKSKRKVWVFIAVGFSIWLLFFSHTTNNPDPGPTFPNGDIFAYTPVDTPAASSATDTPTPAPSIPVVAVYGLAWSPDGKEIASGGADSAVAIWNILTSKQAFIINTDFATINAVAWSPNGKYIATAGDKSEIQIWNASSATQAALYQGAFAGINTLAWSPDSKYLALALTNGAVQLVNAATGSATITSQSGSGVNSVAWSPNGRYLASGNEDTTVQVRDVLKGAVAYTYRGHHGPVTSVMWSPDGTRIASGGADDTVQVWDALTGGNAFSYTESVGGIASLAWSPNGGYLAAGDVGVQVWQIGNGTPRYINTHQYQVLSIAWSPDSKRIASASQDGTVRVWDALTGANAVTYQQP